MTDFSIDLSQEQLIRYKHKLQTKITNTDKYSFYAINNNKTGLYVISIIQTFKRIRN